MKRPINSDLGPSKRQRSIKSIQKSFLKACEQNRVDQAKKMLSGGADVNCKDDDFSGLAGLHWAATKNYGELLELLLTQTGVDVNITGNYNQTPLMVACSSGHENIVRRLSHVPDIQYNCRDVSGWTALHIAVDSNNPQCVEVLRGAGASVDWNVRANTGDYPLTLAVHLGYPDILQIILSVPQLDLSVTDIIDRNIAQIAVEEDEGDSQRVVEILSQDRRVNWNIKNSDGDTPLMYCMKNNKIEIVRCLIKTPGVDLDTVDRDGKHLETVARERNLTDILDMLRPLIRQRISKMKLETIQKSFHKACKQNRVDQVKKMLSEGADVNCKGEDYFGFAGLHIAAMENYGELLELLLTQTGVDVNITNDYNETPLMLACSSGHDNIVRRLSQVPAIQYNCRDDDGCTALYFAVGRNSPQCVEMLRGAGASVDWDVRADNGYYPLTLAVECGYTDILQTILSVPDPQLDLSVTDHRGRNVAQIAVEENREDRQRVVEILSQDRRVNWNIKSSDGDTPLMYCLKNNKMEMARCLINTSGVDLDTIARFVLRGSEESRRSISAARVTLYVGTVDLELRPVQPVGGNSLADVMASRRSYSL